MEKEEKQEKQEKQEKKRAFVKDEGQKFYFNEDGELVVESNKGIWVDGEPYVKMYGNFQCNAKTLGIIINMFKGRPVVVATVREAYRYSIPLFKDFIETTAIVNPTDEDKELMEELSAVRGQMDGLIDLKYELKEANEKFAAAIKRYNGLPWWKRIFKKVEV